MKTYRIFNLLAATIILWPLSALSYTNFSESSDSQPASMSATFEQSCKDTFKLLEDNFSKMLGKAPYVSSVTSLSSSDWKEDSKTSTNISESRQHLMTLSTTVAKDFPATVFLTKASKNICNPENQDPNVTCYDSYTLSLTGSQSRVYQKVVEMNEGSNPFASFNVTINLNANGPTTCNFTSNLSIVNNEYLVVRPELTQNLDPALLEKSLLKGYAGWMKSQLSVMEGK